MEGSTLAPLLLAEDACRNRSCTTRLGRILTDGVVGPEVVIIPVPMSNRLVSLAFNGRGVAHRVAIHFFHLI